MRSTWKVLSGVLALVLVGLGFAWTGPDSPIPATPRSRVAGGVPAALGDSSTIPVSVTVHGPYTPTLSVAVRDLPPYEPGPPELDREPAHRDDHGFIGPDIQMPPHGNPLVDLQQSAPAPAPDDFGTPILNFAGIQSSSSPPDDTGDVGLSHFLQADNGPGGSRVTIYDKAGTFVSQFDMEDLASGPPCSNGYCDPIVQYDDVADRWMISEFDSSASNLCVYVSKTADPTGQWWAYAFNPPGGMQDYPKYAVWPDGYYIAANNGGRIHVLERAKMLLGQAATLQSFDIGSLPGFGFELSLPATVEGPAPPEGEPAFFLRPRDTEIHGGTCPGCDLMEMWAFHVDWAVPANSTVTALAGVQMTDWDQTLCGTVAWNCMPQPGTSQKIDPIREPLHFPLQYRNFGTHETLVGCFAEDVDGTDQAAVHWFELRRTPPGAGNWAKYQEGVVGDGLTEVHRSVCSAAMDSSGNIAVGYTRTGGSAPYYPSIYYSGRLASDPLGTMPYYDHKIWDATNSNTDNERWGDYSGIGVDPADGCTFWYTTEYGGGGQTRIASFKFDECGGGCVAGVEVYPPSAAQPGDPGSTVTYTLRVTNTGNCTDTLDVAVGGNGWPTSAPASVGPLVPSAAADVDVTVDVPAGASCGDMDVATVTFSSQGGSAWDSSVLTTTAAAVYGVLAAPPTDALSGDPGSTVSYTLRITNSGNCADTFDVAVSGNAWPTSAPAAVGPLAAGTAADVDVTVDVPAGAACGDTDLATVTFTSQGDGSVSASSALTTSADTVHGVTAAPPTDALSGDPGSTVSYTLHITNSGNCTDTFEVAVSGNAWPTSAPATVGPLAAGTSADVDVTVNVPAGAACGDTDVATVTFTSQGGSAWDSSLLTTTASAVYGVLAAPPAAALPGEPGSAVSYTLWLTNTGNCSDAFDITLSSNLWPASAPATVGPLAGSAAISVTVAVTIPAGAADGNTDVATITFTSQGDGSVAASSVLTTTAAVAPPQRWLVYLPICCNP